jgi:two-component system response regulator YesN
MDGNMKVVALSAYDDFDYVRGSLKNGAKDYLLKHRLSKESINELIKSLIEEIQAENSHVASSAAGESRDDLLLKIAEGYADIDALAERLEKEKLAWLRDDLLVAVGGVDTRFIGIGDPSDERTMRIVMDEAIKYYRDYFVMPLEPGIFLLVFGASGKTEAEIEETVKQVQATVSRFCSIPLSFVVSDRFRGAENIKFQKDANKTFLLDQYFRGNQQFIARREALEQPDAALGDDQLMQLDEVLYLEEQNIIAHFDGFFAELARKRLSKEWFQVLYMEIVMFLKRKIKAMQLDEKHMFRDEQPYEVWMSFNTCEDMKNYLVGKFIAIQKALKKSFAKHSLSERAMKYVEERYREKITLRQVADALFVSPSYLSRMFKKSTGLNLVTYMNRVKMKHARELILQRNMSLQEIAYEVGIANYNYFYILFKETYGISPSDFLKRIESEAP